MLDCKCADMLMPAGVGALVAFIGITLWQRRATRKRKQNREMPWRSPAKLYHTPSFISARCAWLIEELGVKNHFVIQPYNPYSATREELEWYKKNVHLSGKIPACVFDGHVMTESAAICLYLAEVYGDFLPDRSKEPEFYNWTVQGPATFDHMCRILQRQMDITPEEHQDGALIADTLEKYSHIINTLNDHLERNEYICGNKFTVADICIGYNVMWISCIKGGLLLRDYDHVSNYLKRLKKRKTFERGMGSTRDWINTKQWEYKE